MAIKYKWELITNKALKQKIKQESKPDNKEEKRKRTLFRKNIRFIGVKPKMQLYDWRIIAEKWDTYVVRAKGRRETDFQQFEVEKKRVYFAKS